MKSSSKIKTAYSNARALMKLALFAVFIIIALSSSAQTVVLSDNSPQVGTAFVSQGSTNWLMHKATLTVTGVGYTAITGMSCILSGTFLSTDIVNLKLWYSLDNTFRPGSCTLVSTI